MVAVTGKTGRAKDPVGRQHLPYWLRLRQMIQRHLLSPFWSLPPQMAPGSSGTQYRVGLRFACRSVTGNHRQVNEDRCFADASSAIFMVADGMGGYCGGAAASRIIVETVPAYLQSVLASSQVDVASVEQSVAEAVDAARSRMLEFCCEHPDCDQMGSTVALAAIAETTMFVAHLGDSRVYHLRGESIRRLTSDHTFVQALMEAGSITAEEAQRHPYRHYLLHCVGASHDLERPDVSAIQLMPADRILLATDGLTGVIDDFSLAEMLMLHSQPGEAADALVDAALQLDSTDNISCIIVDVSAVQERERPRDQSVMAVEPMAA